MDAWDGDNYNVNGYKFGLKVCHRRREYEEKCCEFDFKNSENAFPGTIYWKKFIGSTIEMDASSINSQNDNTCQMLDLNATSLLEVSNITITVFPRVSVQGVESLWGDSRFLPADWGS